MPTPEDMREAVLKYFASFATADLDAIVGLFADDAVLEDPVDGARMEGIGALRKFFGGGFDYVGGGYSFEPEGAVRIAGKHAACAAIATCDKADPPFRLETLDVMTFNEAGKIVDMKAYWGPANMRSLTGDAKTGAEATGKAQDFLKSLGR
ncbi:MAG: 3-ketosteroid 5-isomerase [Rhodospirillales bacterium]|nr:3-ketosteroid 5-isomerase [Rhodospirillales bacterium]